ncbi:MAG: ureidoglycolate lyase [Brevirhabdus sp.]
MKRLEAQPLTAEAFAPFGDVLDASGDPDKLINAGLCGRHHDRARLDFDPSGAPGISIFNAESRALPYRLDLLERHPLGSQAFVPLHQNPFLVIVAKDRDGIPDSPVAFVTNPGQGVNFLRNTWHGVLTPLADPGLFAVVDWIGNSENLEEYWLEPQYMVYFA